MNVNQVSSALRSFIEQHFRIDEWGLNSPQEIVNPNLPPSIAREEPAVEEISTDDYWNDLGSPNPLRGNTRFSYTIMFRYAAEFTYEQMLVHKRNAASIVLLMCARIRQQPECVDIEFREDTTATGTVVVVQLENKDWLVVVKLSITPDFEIERGDLDEISTFLQPMV